MPKRPLPPSAATALDIIVSSGSCAMRGNDFALQMHARGFDGRAVAQALKAFERRGWLVQAAPFVEISEEAFASKPVLMKKPPPSKRRHTFLPRGMFAR